MDNSFLLAQISRKLEEARKNKRHNIYLMTVRLDDTNKTTLLKFCKENKLELEIKTCGLGNSDIIISF